MTSLMNPIENLNLNSRNPAWTDPNSNWQYYTKVRPRRSKTFGDNGNDEYQTEMEKAMEVFVGECTIDINILSEHIASEGCYRIEIDTNRHVDEIDAGSNYHVIFLRSKFLQNPRFKKRLIEHYNPEGIFVKGPSEEKRTDGSKLFKWTIELVARTPGRRGF